MTSPTQQEKTLAIAKSMYGDKATVNALEKVLLPIEEEQHGSKPFNPYTSAKDSQAVQKFFKIDTDWEGRVWHAYHTLVNADSECLKTAIADCAYEATKGK